MGNALSVICAGDICTNANADICHGDFAKKVLSGLKPYLSSADYRIVNLENPIAPPGVGEPIIKTGPNLIARPCNIDLLKEGMFDCCVLANNHIGDFGYDAVISTTKILKQSNIAYIGGGANITEAYKAWYIESKGIKVSFIAACENEFGVAGEATPGCAGLNLKLMYDRIKEEKSKSDLVVIIFHGGNEYNPIPSPGACDRYHLFCDFGADAVVAMHTHCPQGYEYYNGKPIIYGMGNFYFPKQNSMSFDEKSPWFYGYMTKLLIEKNSKINFEVIPYKMSRDGAYISPFEGNDKSIFIDYLNKISEIIKNTSEVKRLYEGWCTYYGLRYARMLLYTEEYENTPSGDVLKNLCKTKNVFSCEAHNELVKTTLNLEYAGRLEEAKKAYEDLKELAKMPL